MNFYGYFKAPDNPYWQRIYAYINSRSIEEAVEFSQSFRDRFLAYKPTLNGSVSNERTIMNAFPWSRKFEGLPNKGADYWANYHRIGQGLDFIPLRKKVTRKKML